MRPLAILSALGTIQQVRASVNGWSRRVSHATIYGLAAFSLILVALVFLGTTLFFVLGDALPPAAAAGLVTGLFLVLAVIAGVLARHAIRRGRGGTGTSTTLPAPVAAHDPMAAVGTLAGIDSRTLLALGAGLIGGLIAAQLGARGARADGRHAAE